MKLQKDFTTQLFADYFQNNKNGTHSIKLVVDDISFDVNKFILNCWSEEFEFKSDEDNEIFLTQFDGHKEEIRLCVDLLHGKEINLDISNVAVILKFAAMFKVSDMISSVMKWFKENISLTSFLAISCITNDFNKLGHKFDQLFEIIRTFIEKNTESCIKIFTDYFILNISFVIDMLIYDGPYIRECISLFDSQTRKDTDYKYFLEKIELVSSKNETILVEHSAILNQLLGKVMEQVNDPELLKQYMRFSRNVLADKHRSSGGIHFQSCRGLSKRELLDLQSSLMEFQYASICVNWIQERKPEKDVVLEVFNSFKQEKLEYTFVNSIRETLFTTYDNIPDVQRLPVYEYEHQMWYISSQQILDCLKNNTAVQLSWLCCIPNCPNQQTDHTVNIRLVNKYGKVSVQVLPLDTENGHTHSSDNYLFWYLVVTTKIDILGNSSERLCYFNTNSFNEILKFSDWSYEISIECLMIKNY